MKTDLTMFEEHQIRRIYDEDREIWWFSVIDIVRVLTQQDDYQTARKYWNKLKQRLAKEGSQSVTDCHRLKLPAADGKNYLTDVATAETLLRLVQSVPSPKAEPFKLVEFDQFRFDAGGNAFVLSPKQWIENTGAVGLVSKPGRYGGTFAHKDIAFEFAKKSTNFRGGDRWLTH